MNDYLKEAILVHQQDTLELKLLSEEVLECLETIDSFSLKGEYINWDNPNGRMSHQDAEMFRLCYFNLFTETNLRKLQKITPKKLLKKLKPMHAFIIGIYRHGTPSHRFESKRVDEDVSDEMILEYFALALKEKLIVFVKQKY